MCYVVVQEGNVKLLLVKHDFLAVEINWFVL